MGLPSRVIEGLGFTWENIGCEEAIQVSLDCRQIGQVRGEVFSLMKIVRGKGLGFR